jgi:ELWxxDGT repeat protein
MTASDTLRAEIWPGRWVGVVLVSLILSVSPPASAEDVPVALKDFGSGGPGDLTDVDGTVFFRANGDQLWRSDGTAAGTALVSNAPSLNPLDLTAFGGRLLFSGNSYPMGQELWSSDGTPAGTTIVKDISPGTECGGWGPCRPHSSTPDQLTTAGAIVFFTASTDVGMELWRSDGTTAGTFLIKDIDPSDLSSYLSSFPAELTNVNGVLFFSAEIDPINQLPRLDLWRSDGTDAGTLPLAIGISPAALTAVNGTLFFAASDGATGRELWRSDGTVAGTTMVADIVPGSLGSNPADLTDVDGILFFTASTADNGRELWRSDGTAAGTLLVADVSAGTRDSNPANLTNVDGTLFFTASTPASGRELWRSDGTTAGTVLVKDMVPGPAGADSTELTAVGSTLYFVALDPAHGRELWRSDGTATGTKLVADILPGPDSSSPSALTNVHGRLFFNAREPGTGSELWTLRDRSPLCGNGIIDPGESCDAADARCCARDCTPRLAGTVCRQSAGPCDQLEICDERGMCPTDVLLAAGTICRPAAGSCDVAETCDGLVPTCPGDAFATQGTPCPTEDICSTGATCDDAGRCNVAPEADCKAPIEAQGATLELLRESSVTNGTASWKWTKGTPTEKTEFGDPIRSTSYALCVFDTIAGVPGLVFESTIPPGGICNVKPCWRESHAGFRYTNSVGSPEGITKLTLTQGLTPGRAKITLKGKGVSLPPLPLPLAQDPAVTVQLKNTAGGCWTADFGTAIVNDPRRFKAKSD